MQGVAFLCRSADIHAHWPTRITVDKCIVLHLNEHPTSSSICLSVEAAGTGMDYDTAHSAHVYVNFERPLRDVSTGHCASIRRIALVPFQFLQDIDLLCVVCAPRRPPRAIADAVFGARTPAPRSASPTFVCDYLRSYQGDRHV